MKKTLQSIYETMGQDPVIEEAKEPNNFSKFDLKDYTEIVYEKNVLGTCKDEELIENIFGSVSEFARQVELNGDNFIYDNVKIRYDEFTDTHYFLTEGKSGHGDEKKIKELIKQAIDRKLIKPFPKDTKNGWMLQSIADHSQYLTHKGEKGFHDLRRYIEKLEKIS